MEHNEKATLQNAIDRSREYNEIVHLDWAADAVDEAVSWIYETYAGNVDHVSTRNVTELWGWMDEQDEGEMDFRIHLHAVHTKD